MKTNENLDFNNDLVVTLEIINPELAQEFLKCNIHNRPFNKLEVLRNAYLMQQGKWKETCEPIAITRGNVLLNGQHRLAAVIRSGTTQRFLVSRGHNEDDGNAFDCGLTRTGTDALARNGVENFNKIAPIINKYLKFIHSSGFSICGEVVKYRPINTDVVDEYYLRPAFYQSVLLTATSAHRKQKILSLTEIGFYMTYLMIQKKHKEEAVKNFFLMIVTGDSECNAINLFRNKVIDAGLRNIRINSVFKRAILIKAWNAYITGKQVKVLSYNPNKESFPEFL